VSLDPLTLRLTVGIKKEDISHKDMSSFFEPVNEIGPR